MISQKPSAPQPPRGMCRATKASGQEFVIEFDLGMDWGGAEGRGGESEEGNGGVGCNGMYVIEVSVVSSPWSVQKRLSGDLS